MDAFFPNSYWSRFPVVCLLHCLCDPFQNAEKETESVTDDAAQETNEITPKGYIGVLHGGIITSGSQIALTVDGKNDRRNTEWQAQATGRNE